MEALIEETFEQNLLELGVNLMKGEEVVKLKPFIGIGGFGKVYKGKFGSNVIAIKKIKFADFDDQDKRREVYMQILNEVRVIILANHPKIPKFYGVWKNKNSYHLLFEFIDGKNWRDTYSGMKRRDKLQILSGVCDVLDDFHSKNLIHRDIKPDNVMITSENKPKLIDFGISRVASRVTTFTKNTIGTYLYQAPELTNFDIDNIDPDDKDAKFIPISTSSDIWSVGCMISEVLSGITPWHQNQKKLANEEMWVNNQKMKMAKFPIPVQLDDKVKEIVKKTTDYDPLKRPNARELKEMLDKIIEEENEIDN
jgi:serine/threonine-protein kinase